MGGLGSTIHYAEFSGLHNRGRNRNGPIYADHKDCLPGLSYKHCRKELNECLSAKKLGWGLGWGLPLCTGFFHVWSQRECDLDRKQDEAEIEAEQEERLRQTQRQTQIHRAISREMRGEREGRDKGKRVREYLTIYSHPRSSQFQKSINRFWLKGIFRGSEGTCHPKVQPCEEQSMLRGVRKRLTGCLLGWQGGQG